MKVEKVLHTGGLANGTLVSNKLGLDFVLYIKGKKFKLHKLVNRRQ